MSKHELNFLVDLDRTPGTSLTKLWSTLKVGDGFYWKGDSAIWFKINDSIAEPQFFIQTATKRSECVKIGLVYQEMDRWVPCFIIDGNVGL